MNRLLDELILPIAAERLVPHRPPFCLIQSLLEINTNGGIADAVIAEKHPLLESSGNLAPVTMVEMMAQALASIKGYVDIKRGKPVKMGFLVGIRRFKVMGRCSRGDRLVISIEVLKEFGGFVVAEGEVRCRDRIIGYGNFKLWIREDVEERA